MRDVSRFSGTSRRARARLNQARFTAAMTEGAKMAGCCVVFLSILMVPILAVCAAALIAIRFVTSPAFLFLLASGILCVVALVDAVRILWLRWRGETDERLTFASFKRPLILLAISLVLFIIMGVLAGSMIMEWYAEFADASRQAGFIGWE